MDRGSRLFRHGSAVQFLGRSSLDEVGRLFADLRSATLGHDVAIEDLFVAEELVRMSRWLSPRQTQALCFLVVASIIHAKQGSTRLPLGGGPRGVLGQLLSQLARAAGLALPVSPLLKDIDSLARGNYFGRLIGSPGEFRPLISHAGCVYQQRHFAAEETLLDRIKSRVLQPAPDQPRSEVVKGGAFDLSDEQQAAVALALDRPLAIIAGGPGTGKTAIAATILRSAYAAGIESESMALAAPTGKAAQRLSQSLRSDLGESEFAPPAPTTLHRLLGYRASGGFRHHENHPLRARLVVIDEASMIDLVLMDRLLAALSPSCRLVLLGDADQLPSVEAGSVFRDLVIAGDRVRKAPRYSARLTQSFRMDPRDPAGRAIYELSRHVCDGKAAAIAQVPRFAPAQLPFEAAARVAGDDPATLDELCDEWLRRHFGSTELREAADHLHRTEAGELGELGESSIRGLLAELERAKVLTATRHGRFGSTALAERLHSAFRQHLGGPPNELGPGEPVLVTRNDYRRGLFNGDTGVVVRVADPDGPAHLRVAFSSEGGIRLFPSEALRGVLELGHATTIHRSQGSEYMHALVVLPQRPIPLLTRELLYTAMTRARLSVTLFGPTASYRAAIRRTAERFSGIVDGLASAT